MFSEKKPQDWPKRLAGYIMGLPVSSFWDPRPQLDDSPMTSLQGSSMLPPSTLSIPADKTTLIPPRYGSLRCEHPLLPSTRETGQTLQDNMGGDGHTRWPLLQIQTGRQQSPGQACPLCSNGGNDNSGSAG